MKLTTWLMVVTLALQITSCVAISPFTVAIPAIAVGGACNTWATPDVEARETFWCDQPTQSGRDPSGWLILVALLVLLLSLVLWILPTAMLSARWDEYRARKRG